MGFFRDWKNAKNREIFFTDDESHPPIEASPRETSWLNNNFWGKVNCLEGRDWQKRSKIKLIMSIIIGAIVCGGLVLAAPALVTAIPALGAALASIPALGAALASIPILGPILANMSILKGVGILIGGFSALIAGKSLYETIYYMKQAIEGDKKIDPTPPWLRKEGCAVPMNEKGKTFEIDSQSTHKNKVKGGAKSVKGVREEQIGEER